MEVSKQEMELFLLFTDFRLKNFFYKMFLSFDNDTKTGFENRKWNYLNRKWNYCQTPVRVDIGVDVRVDLVFPCHKNKNNNNNKNLT